MKSVIFAGKKDLLSLYTAPLLTNVPDSSNSIFIRKCSYNAFNDLWAKYLQDVDHKDFLPLDTSKEKVVWMDTYYFSNTRYYYEGNKYYTLGNLDGLIYGYNSVSDSPRNHSESTHSCLINTYEGDADFSKIKYIADGAVLVRSGKYNNLILSPLIKYLYQIGNRTLQINHPFDASNIEDIGDMDGDNLQLPYTSLSNPQSFPKIVSLSTTLLKPPTGDGNGIYISTPNLEEINFRSDRALYHLFITDVPNDRILKIVDGRAWQNQYSRYSPNDIHVACKKNGFDCSDAT